MSSFNKDNIIENSSYKGYVGHSAEEHEKSKTPIQKPVSKQKFHKDEILRVIRKLGFDPNSIPKWQGGKRGVKADVRDELLSNSFSLSSFKHAWDSLRVTGEIKDQKACSP